jgi:hypothetical protein
VDAWTSPLIRNAWLDVHITLVLLGFAALAFTAGAHAITLVHGNLVPADGY